MADKYYISYKEFISRERNSFSSLENKYFYERHKLKDDFIIKYYDKMSWDWLVRTQKISEDLLRKLNEKIMRTDWGSICFWLHLSEKFMDEFADRLEWRFVSAHQDMSEEFMTKHADRLDWTMVSERFNLSKNFIRKFANKVDWRYIVQKPYLDISFFREFEDYIKWDKLVKYRKDLLDVSIFREYNKQINNEIDAVCEYGKCGEGKIIEEYKKIFMKKVPCHLMENVKVSDEFILRNIEFFSYHYLDRYRIWLPFYSDVLTEARGLEEAAAKAKRIKMGLE